MSMKDWENTIVNPDTPILEAMRIIDTGAMQISLVVDAEQRLVGVVTDGDIRRGILKGIPLDQPVHLIMNRQFTSAPLGVPREEILSLMKLKDLRHIPVVDDRGQVVDLNQLVDLIQPVFKDNWVVLMAGGKGTRLRPFTDECPKPLLKVGNKPVLETILENSIEYGLRRFYISVNYKAKIIESYFGDGSRWGVVIEYLREEEPMGTAGALSLLTKRPDLPFIVMNGDVLTKVSMEHLIDFHNNYKAMASVGVGEYLLEVPFGVIKTDQHLLKSIDEKPVYRFFVNAGIYILDPIVLEFIPKNTYLDMPTLLSQLVKQGYNVTTFPIREYWRDIGKPEDFEQASHEYHEIFNKEEIAP